jgi:hypothetical protein
MDYDIHEACQVACQAQKKYFFNRKKIIAFSRGCAIL